MPEILLRVAHQPVARGGLRHFTAGNIRIVTKARELVENEGERLDFSKGMSWNDDEWMASLESHFGILEVDRGNIEREQLVVGGQCIYQCNGCSRLV
jgi:hypothetical protein